MIARILGSALNERVELRPIVCHALTLLIERGNSRGNQWCINLIIILFDLWPQRRAGLCWVASQRTIFPSCSTSIQTLRGRQTTSLHWWSVLKLMSPYQVARHCFLESLVDFIIWFQIPNFLSLSLTKRWSSWGRERTWQLPPGTSCLTSLTASPPTSLWSHSTLSLSTSPLC